METRWENDPQSHLLSCSDCTGEAAATPLTAGLGGMTPSLLTRHTPGPPPSTNTCNWVRVTAYRWHWTLCTQKMLKYLPRCQDKPWGGEEQGFMCLQYSDGIGASNRVVRIKPRRIRFARIPTRSQHQKVLKKPVTAEPPCISAVTALLWGAWGCWVSVTPAPQPGGRGP